MDIDLNMPIGALKGIGEKTKEKFIKTGISTLRDMLYYFPRNYRDFSKLSNIADNNYNVDGLYRVKVISSPSTRKVRSNLEITSFTVTDGSGFIILDIFNRAYISSRLREGLIFYIYGKPVVFNNEPHISSPDIFFEAPKAGYYPIYPLSNGLTQAVVNKYINLSLSLGEITDIYTDKFLEKFGMPNITQTLNNMHYPANLQLLECSKKRLVFDELLIFCKMLELLNNEESQKNTFKAVPIGAKREFISKLPFNLTDGQLKIIDEILTDMSGETCMNRLIQGDVGAGKTILALFAMHCANCAGYQSVLMAPTEVLANQHFNTAMQYFENDEVVLLTGSVSTKERSDIIEKIKSGKAKIIIGTHALLYMDIKFPSLALLITDEQHRFGVKQRAVLTNNCDNDIHMLIMSATPIPRSLALVLYGKTDISVLKDKPEGRLPVKTFIIKDNKKEAMLNFIKDEVIKGHQAYFVCPLIESDNEDAEDADYSAQNVYRSLSEHYPQLNVGLLHGKMKSADKQSVMQHFVYGEIDVLVSTTVIEVGVNVPNATIMVIEKPEYFGLAQTHQLRGRIGRGEAQSYCFLLTEETNNIERLQILCQTNDGFEIAEKDLIMRGMGNIFGTHQHGNSPLKYTDLMRDNDMLNLVQNTLNTLKTDPALSQDYNTISNMANEILQRETIEIAMN